MTQSLMEKWAPVLEHSDMPAITDPYRKQVTAVLLENQERALKEQHLNEAIGNVAGDVSNFDPVLIGLVRRSMPKLLAYDLCGVQPMNLPTGLVFAMRSKYQPTTGTMGNEALFNEANSAYSGDFSGAPGDGTQAGTSPVAADVGLGPWDSSPGFTYGSPMSTSKAETVVPAEMGFTIEKLTVTANSRALAASYSIELAQDLKAVHGLDAESELSNILSTEITAEMNREIIRRIYTAAKTGADYGTTTAGTFDLDVDSNGRWSVERFKGMLFQIERDANRIAQTTRRGKGNIILCSSDVASALAMAGMLDFSKISADLDVDPAGNTFVGTLNGKYKVYVDPYMANGSLNQYYVVGYKGTSPYDAGMFYCPYVPLQMLRAVDPTTFQPKIGFKTRYGVVGNPLQDPVNGEKSDPAATMGLTAGSNNYYRMVKVANLT
jgi:hypothetical protein